MMGMWSSILTALNTEICNELVVISEYLRREEKCEYVSKIQRALMSVERRYGDVDKEIIFENCRKQYKKVIPTEKFYQKKDELKSGEEIKRFVEEYEISLLEKLESMCRSALHFLTEHPKLTMVIIMCSIGGYYIYTQSSVMMKINLLERSAKGYRYRWAVRVKSEKVAS